MATTPTLPAGFQPLPPDFQPLPAAPAPSASALPAGFQPLPPDFKPLPAAEPPRPSVADQLANRPGPAAPPLPSGLQSPQQQQVAEPVQRSRTGALYQPPAPGQSLFDVPANAAQEIVQGAEQIAGPASRGAVIASGTGYYQPTKPLSPEDARQATAGVSQIIKGGMTLAAPAAAVGLAVAPVATLATLGAGTVADIITQKGLKAAGVAPEYADLAGTIASILSAYGVAGVRLAPEQQTLLEALKGEPAAGGPTGETSRIEKLMTMVDRGGTEAERIAAQRILKEQHGVDYGPDFTKAKPATAAAPQPETPAPAPAEPTPAAAAPPLPPDFKPVAPEAPAPAPPTSESLPAITRGSVFKTPTGTYTITSVLSDGRVLFLAETDAGKSYKKLPEDQFLALVAPSPVQEAAGGVTPAAPSPQTAGETLVPSLPETPTPPVSTSGVPGETPPTKSPEVLPWYMQEQQRLFGDAQRLGIVQDIERLSAQELTARQVTRQLADKLQKTGEGEFAKQDRDNLVRAVRNVLGIPSMDDKTEFEKWLKQRSVTPPVPSSPHEQSVTVNPSTSQGAPGPAELPPGFTPLPAESAPVDEFASTQANIPESMAAEVRAVADGIPKDELHEKGTEPQPHITALYGLHADEPSEVAKVLSSQAPINATFGPAMVFHSPDEDVLVVKVESPDLHRINAALQELPHTSDFPDYKPHMTLAYLKPGEGAKYDGNPIPGITGQSVTLNSIAFSGKDGKQTEIPLAGKPRPNSGGLSLVPKVDGVSSTAQPEGNAGTPGVTEPSSSSPTPESIGQSLIGQVRQTAMESQTKGVEQPQPPKTLPEIPEKTPAPVLQMPVKGETLEEKKARVRANEQRMKEIEEQLAAQGATPAPPAPDIRKVNGSPFAEAPPEFAIYAATTEAIEKATNELQGIIENQGGRMWALKNDATVQRLRAAIAGGEKVQSKLPAKHGGQAYALQQALESARPLLKSVDESTAPRVRGIDSEGALTAAGLTPSTSPISQPGNQLAAYVYAKLKSGSPLGNQPDFYRTAEQFFGSPRTSGQWDVKDAMDAMEAGVNKWLIDNGARLMAMDPIQALAELRKLQSLLPTQGTRTEEQLKAQQFSTPPTESFVAAKAAGILPTDVVLEPSAGNGGLAAWPKSLGAQVHVNEISDRRAQMLEAAGFGKPTAHDGELINALLDTSVKPTVVLMNPPFSSGALKSHAAKNRNQYGFNHVDQALQRLQPGGRLVAILGGGRADDLNGGASFTGGATGKWFDRVRKLYNIRANVRIDGKEYGKYGTNFATRIIVIDKNGPTPDWQDALLGKGQVVQGNAKTLEEAYNLLRNVANDRPAPQNGNAVSSGQSQPGAGVGTGTGANRPGSGALQPSGRGPVEAGQPEVRPDGTPGSPGPMAPQLGAESPDRREPEPGSPQSHELPGITTSPSNPEPAQLGSVPGDREPGKVLAEPLSGEEGTSGVVPIETVDQPNSEHEDSAAYVAYKPTIKGGNHPGDIVETKTMATVPLPPITAKVNLPANVGISGVQLEGVAIGVQQNEIMLPGGFRAAALIGDGTGVGKGREAAAYLWSNFRSGRKRLVWVSEKWDLIQDAMRDLTGIGATDMLGGIERQPDGKFVVTPKSAVQPFNRWNYGAKIDHQGLIFSTYGTVRAKDKKGNRRVAQLETYLRGDDDGEGAAIVFDEAHNLKNAVPARGTPASQIGQAVKELLERIPKLRTLSLSATAATDVVNLGYLDRLGLWGPGTPFPNGFSEFQNKIARGGLSAMEMIARELKAQGKYISRTLSFHGVEYVEKEHQLTDEQKELYRTAAKAWGVVLANAGSTIANVTNGGGEQRGNFLSQFYGAQQRFFNLLITTLKIPTAVELANQALADGKSVVISLVNTNEAAQNREKNKARGEDDEDEIPDYDFGPKEMLVNLIKNHYPTQQYADDVNDNGDPVKVPVYTTDAQGHEIPVQNPAAIEARDALIAEINRDLHMPDNPLDILMQSLGGAKKVAELTGRKERYDRNTGKFVSRGDPGTAQKDINLVEMRNFQSGKKRVAVLSGAAGTGISLHAGNDVANQQRRYHITLQVGWSADKAMQMFGRTHRTNQKQPPEYVMLTSDLGGEKRFVSTISRRFGLPRRVDQGAEERHRRHGPDGEGQLRDRPGTRCDQHVLRADAARSASTGNEPDGDGRAPGLACSETWAERRHRTASRADERHPAPESLAGA